MDDPIVAHRGGKGKEEDSGRFAEPKKKTKKIEN
jgi:hypothetical protein